MEKKIKITVYGADQICPSCINAPGSKDTYEWLQAAIVRKYGRYAVEFEYIDIFHPSEAEEQRTFADRVKAGEFFYPVVLVDGEVVDEGNPRLKKVFWALEGKGIKVK